MLNTNHVFGMVGGEVGTLELLDLYDNRCKDQKRENQEYERWGKLLEV